MRAAKSRGQALIEFMLALPLALIFFGMFVDLGMLLLMHQLSAHSAYAAGTAAVSLPDLEQNDSRVREIGEKTAPVGFGVTNSAPNAAGRVTVQVAGSFQPIFLRLIGIGSTPVSREIEVVRPPAGE